MQDEINSQIVALSIRTGKETARITTRVLQQRSGNTYRIISREILL